MFTGSKQLRVLEKLRIEQIFLQTSFQLALLSSQRGGLGGQSTGGVQGIRGLGDGQKHRGPQRLRGTEGGRAEAPDRRDSQD